MKSQYVARAIKVVALAAFASIGLAGAGVARECKTDAIVAEGEPALSRNLGAYQNSLFAWRRAVAEKVGPEFNSWRYADARTVDCNEVKTPNGQRWVCKRSAKPCKDTLSTVISGEKLEKFECKNDPISAYGRREVKEAEAMEQAKWAWRLAARKKYDASWGQWDTATGADLDCRKVGSKVQCVGVATPCKAK